MGRSPGFGSATDDSADAPLGDAPRPFGLAFAPAPPDSRLSLAIANNSSAHSTKGTPSPGLPRRQPSSDRPGAHGFRISFTPLTGVLFTVPSRYWFTIGRRGCLALGGGPPRFPPNPTWWAVLTRPGHPAPPAVAYGTLTLSGDPFQRSSADGDSSGARPLPGSPPRPSYPRPASAAACATGRVWALPLSLAATRGLLSLPRGTEMFQFPRFPPSDSRRTAPGLAPGQVAPFGYPRITGCQRLPGAFRRVATPFLGPRRHRHPPCALICRSSPRPPGVPRPPHRSPGRARRPSPRAGGRRGGSPARARRSRSGADAISRRLAPPGSAGPPSTPHTPPRAPTRAVLNRSHVRVHRASLRASPRDAAACPTTARRPGPGDHPPPAAPRGPGAASCVVSPARGRPRASTLVNVVTGVYVVAGAAAAPGPVTGSRHRLVGCVTGSPAGVGAPGLEPGASALSGPRSDHLSYAPPPRPTPPRGATSRSPLGHRSAISHRSPPVGSCPGPTPAGVAPCRLKPARVDGRRWGPRVGPETERGGDRPRHRRRPEPRGHDPIHRDAGRRRAARHRMPPWEAVPVCPGLGSRLGERPAGVRTPPRRSPADVSPRPPGVTPGSDLAPPPAATPCAGHVRPRVAHRLPDGGRPRPRGRPGLGAQVDPPLPPHADRPSLDDRPPRRGPATPLDLGHGPPRDPVRSPRPVPLAGSRPSLPVRIPPATLPRKEVIQPQLPLRLPCYDFVPITHPALDGCRPGPKTAVGPPASGVAGFHDVTGGVYKAREHIHRSSADLRLLATPASRGRVAAPDPNYDRVSGIRSTSRFGHPLSRPL